MPSEIPKLGEKSWWVLYEVGLGNDSTTEYYIDYPQMIERLLLKRKWVVSRQALQHILRLLINHGLMSKMGIRQRRNRPVQTFGLTTRGREILRTMIEERPYLFV